MKQLNHAFINAHFGVILYKPDEVIHVLVLSTICADMIFFVLVVDFKIIFKNQEKLIVKIV